MLTWSRLAIWALCVWFIVRGIQIHQTFMVIIGIVAAVLVLLDVLRVGFPGAARDGRAP